MSKFKVGQVWQCRSGLYRTISKVGPTGLSVKDLSDGLTSTRHLDGQMPYGCKDSGDLIRLISEAKGTNEMKTQDGVTITIGMTLYGKVNNTKRVVLGFEGGDVISRDKDEGLVTRPASQYVTYPKKPNGFTERYTVQASQQGEVGILLDGICASILEKILALNGHTVDIIVKVRK